MPTAPRNPRTTARTATRITTRITTRNARFQQWCSLLTNRNKRGRAGEFLVQGVRPVTLAVEHGWPVRALLHPDGRRLSTWARDLLASDTQGERVAMAPELLAELSERDDADAEVIAVVGMPADDLTRVPVGDTFLGVLFDRPTSPGNIGSILRSADAFGADGLIVTGHAADPYDPKSVRASTGSLFALPTVRVPSPREVLDWLPAHVTVLAADERGDTPLYDADLTGPVLLLVGNETTGLSHTWHTHAHRTLTIPMRGAASSLNAANAATTLLYETSRQRR